MAERFTREMHNLAVIGLPEVPLLGTYRNLTAREGLDDHVHPGILEICYQVGGRQVYRVGGKDYLLQAGDVFISFPGEVHSTGQHPQERGSLFWLQAALPKSNAAFLGLRASASRELAAGLRGLRQRHYRGSALIEELFRRLFAAYARPGPLQQTVMASLLVQLLCEVVVCEQRETVEPRASMQEVLAYIDDHLDESIAVEDLAGVAGLSCSWFKARFRREVGVPPGEYILQRKVDHAKDLLVHRRLTITEIAFRLGFSSSQYFATVFKRFTMASPSAWRRRGPAAPDRR